MGGGLLQALLEDSGVVYAPLVAGGAVGIAASALGVALWNVTTTAAESVDIKQSACRRLRFSIKT